MEYFISKDINPKSHWGPRHPGITSGKKTPIRPKDDPLPIKKKEIKKVKKNYFIPLILGVSGIIVWYALYGIIRYFVKDTLRNNIILLIVGLSIPIVFFREVYF